MRIPVLSFKKNKIKLTSTEKVFSVFSCLQTTIIKIIITMFLLSTG